MKTLHFENFSDDLISDLVAREAILWLTSYDELNAPTDKTRAALIELPWRAVLIESASKELVKDVEARSADALWIPVRGYLHLVASDPVEIHLPRRAQPIYFLAGRADVTNGLESAALSDRAALKRRLNMVSQAAENQPRRVFVVGPRPAELLDDLIELWSKSARPHITIVTTEETQKTEFCKDIETRIGLTSLTWLDLAEDQFTTDVVTRVRALLHADQLLVRAKLPNGQLIEANLTSAEQAEHPLLDSCELIPVRHLFSLTENDLSQVDFQDFFTRRGTSWRPFAARLPWIPDQTPITSVLKQLEMHLKGDANAAHLVTISAESGSGGTTMARAIAFASAEAGFIPIIAKQHVLPPKALELVRFMFKSIDPIREVTGKADKPVVEIEPAWLLVLDVEHYDRLDAELALLIAELQRSGRKCLVLKVVRPDTQIESPIEIVQKEIAWLGHDVSFEQVQDLGKHVNRFLGVHAQSRPIESWTAFWNEHRPDIDTGLASFWIALEFWLAGYLNLGESIQQWVHKQFKASPADTPTKTAILEIAAFSVERRALPEVLLETLSSGSDSWLQKLDSFRNVAPAVGPIRVRAPELGNVWAFAHDVLARYLINGVHYDMPLCRELKLPDTTDATAFRLSLIRSVCSRSAISSSQVRPLVNLLATSILKLDEQTGNAEFFPHWREVLGILDSIPAQVRQSSRTLNHHLAISRRRVCQGEVFGASQDDQMGLLNKARDEVEFAIERISPSKDDESDLNLYNTLALVYQDLASLERRTTNRKNVVIELLSKSDDATKKALRENPSNSYVLETAARNLLRRAPDLSEVDQVRTAAEALAFVHQAFSLDSAERRRIKLGKLADEALVFLQKPSASAHIDKLCLQENPYGYMAKAWLLIANESRVRILEDIRSDVAAKALTILESAPEVEWPLVKLMYELQTSSDQFSFEKQLLRLEQLNSFNGYQLSLQLRLEWAVLLHQRGRHKEAGTLFASIRRESKLSGVVLFVPSRLRWLLSMNANTKLVCTATAVDQGAGRAMAQVRELANLIVPMRPQEFGKEHMATGERFRCNVSFGPMGPFLKPVETNSP